MPFYPRRRMRTMEAESERYKDCVPERMDPEMFIRNLQRAINDEASAIAFYQKLIEAAPEAWMRDWVTIAHNDEIKHLGMTTCLYGKLTGREPRITVTEIPLINFKEGVRVALSNELDAAEFYRDMYLATRDPEIRDIFFELMTDELEHSTRFAFIYNQLP